MAMRAAIILAIIATVGAIDSCDVRSGERCPIARDGKAYDAHFIGDLYGKLPRPNRKAKFLPSSLAKYDIMQCAAGTSTAAGDCKVEVNPVIDPKKVIDELKSGAYASNTVSPMNYVEGVAIYPALAILIAVLFSIFSTFLIIFRYCCCCCGRGGGCCGGKYPQPTCCCGFDRRRQRYGGCAKACAYIWMVLFVLLTGGAIAVGYLMGVREFADGALQATRAPSGIASLVRSLTWPAGNLTIGLVGGTLSTALRGVSDAVTQRVNLTGVRLDVECVRDVVDGAPDPAVLIGFVDDIQTTINTLPEHQSTLATLRNLNSSVATARSTLPDLRASLNAYDVALQPVRALNVSGDLLNLNTSVAAVRPFPALVIDTFAAVDSRMPSTQLLNSLVDRAGVLQVNGSRAATVNYGIDFRDELLSDLAGVRANLTAMPDLSALASSLSTLNSTIDSVNATLVAVETSLQTLQSSINALPNATALLSQLESLDGVVRGFAPDEIRAVLVAINASLASVPDLSILRPQIDRIYAVNNSLPCIDSLLSVVTIINDTLVQLPSGLDGLVDQLRDVNGTVMKAIDQASSLESNIDSFNNTLSQLPNMTRYIADFDAMRGDLDSFNSTLNLTSMIDSVRRAVSGTSVSFDSVLSSLRSVRDSLSGPSARPSQSMIDSLTSLNGTLSSLPATLTDATDGIRRWQSGFCVASPSTACVCSDRAACFGGAAGPSGDCPSGGNCDMSTAAVFPSRCAVSTSTSCSSDGDCTSSGDYCLFPSMSTLTTRVNSALADVNSRPSSSSITGSMQTVQSSLDSMPNLDDKRAEADSMLADVSSLPNATEYGDRMQSLERNLDSIPDVAELIRQWDSVNSTLSSLPDLQSVRESLSSFNSTLQQLPRDQMDTGVDYVRKAETFIYSNLTTLLDRISVPALQAANEARGLRGVVEEVLTMAEDAAAVWKSGGVSLSNGSTVQDALSYVDRIESREAMSRGPLYYLAFVANYSTVLATGAGDRLMTDASGVSYVKPAGDRSLALCVTQECLDATIKAYARQPLDKVVTKPVALPLSGEQLMGAFYVFPVLVLLVAIWSMLCLCCNPRCNPALCVSLLVYVMGPLMLIITGGMLFPMTLVLTDVCAATEPLAFRYLDLSWPTICNSTAGGTPDTASSTCTIGVRNYTLYVDLVDVGAELLGGCPADGNSALHRTFMNMSGQVSPLPRGELDKFLNDSLGSLPVKPREAMLAPLRDGATSASHDVENLFGNMSNTLSCSALQSSLLPVRDVLCGGVVSPLAVYIGSWCAIAFCFIFLGCGAGLCGNKRFPRRVWGPFYRPDAEGHDSHDVEEPAEAFDIAERPAEAASGGAQQSQQQPAIARSRQQYMFAPTGARSGAGGGGNTLEMKHF